MIQYRKITSSDIDTIFSWLAQDFIKEFWDNSQEHKEDIINFVEGRRTPSAYCDGQYVYWLALENNQAFALLMTIQETHASPINQEKLDILSKTGHSYGLDFMIGNPQFFGKGYGVKTLNEFLDYFRSKVDPKADVFMIDPATDNSRAKYVYMKAGFETVADFVMQGDVSSVGGEHHLLVRKFK